MRYTTIVLILLACCAAQEPPKAPTAMDVYLKIREALMGASTVRTSFRDTAFYPNVSITCLIASGNRARLSPASRQEETVRILNGDREARVGPPGAMPYVGPSAEQTLDWKRELLRGLPPGFPRGYIEKIDERHYAHAGSWLACTQILDAVVKDDRLTFTAADPDPKKLEQYTVTIRFDPATFVPRTLQTTLPPKGYGEIRITTGVELDVDAPDRLFELPEDPKISIGCANAELDRLRAALDNYAIDNHAYPTTEQGLEALKREPVPKPRNWKGPYLGDDTPTVDPWGHPYEYRSPRPKINPGGYDLRSWGWDGKPDTPDDLKR